MPRNGPRPWNLLSLVQTGPGNRERVIVVFAYIDNITYSNLASLKDLFFKRVIQRAPGAAEALAATVFGFLFSSW
jgi:hypothetical protein